MYKNLCPAALFKRIGSDVYFTADGKSVEILIFLGLFKSFSAERKQKLPLKRELELFKMSAE